MYEVIVGNVGRVYEGDSETDARKTYDEYVKLSQSGIGRAAQEEVTLMCDGEEVAGYLPT